MSEATMLIPFLVVPTAPLCIFTPTGLHCCRGPPPGRNLRKAITASRDACLVME